MIRIYGVDPGKMTGVACVAERPAPDLPKWRVWTMDAMTAVDWIYMDILSTPRYYGLTVIAVERWNQESVRHTRQPDALEVIGALRFVARRTGASFELQNRADRMRADVKLARQIASDADVHGQDASRHAMIALVRHGRGLLLRPPATMDLHGRTSKE